MKHRRAEVDVEPQLHRRPSSDPDADVLAKNSTNVWRSRSVWEVFRPLNREQNIFLKCEGERLQQEPALP